MTENHAVPAIAPGTSKQRRSERISLELPIQLIGSGWDGTAFTEATHTVVLSRHGAGVVSQYKLMAEQELILRDVRRNREAEVRVVGSIAQQGKMHTYGLAFVDERLDFWEREFPPAAAWDERPEVLALECGGCNNVVKLTNGDFEYDICAIHGGLARFCKECGMMTVWRHTIEMTTAGRQETAAARKAQVTDKGAAVAVAEMIRPAKEAEEFVTVEEATGRADRRNKVRAKVNFFACVRSEKYGEEIVKCLDMSRGGVSFRSGKEFLRGMMVKIAVPFSPEEKQAPAIFVRGRITNVMEIAGGMYRCGVEFLK